MTSFEKSVKILYERLMIIIIGFSSFLVIFHFFKGNIDRMMPKLMLLSICAICYILSKFEKEKIAYHFFLSSVILFYVASYYTVSSQLYSTVMVGCTLTIWSFIFYTDRRIQLGYVMIIILLELLLFHQAMGEEGFNLSENYWPECIAGISHILLVFVLSHFFTHRLRQSTKEIDRRTAEVVQQNEDLKQQEESLQNYIESNTNLEIFTSLASHELKSPMRIIKSFVDLISKRRKELSEDQIEDYLNMISINSEKMSNLVDALHDLSSVSQQDPIKEMIPLNPLIESIKAEESQTYMGSIISIDYDIDRVFGEPDLLRRLFSNLLSNALKFSSRESKAIIHISCFERRGYFCYRISDNGIGINLDKRNEVFELFNRQTNYVDYKGLGIGLALSKKIVEMHAGTIHITDSHLGGVCFEVRLPMS